MLKSKFNIKQFEAHCKGIRRATPVNADEATPEKYARIERAKRDYKFFFEYYFPHYAKAPTAKFHVRLANALKDNNTFRGIFEAFRGAAKSVHSNIGFSLWLRINGLSKCLLLLSDTEPKACRLLAALQAELKNNQRYLHDFGEQVTWGSWEKGEFVCKDGYAAFALGVGQSPRGTRSGEYRPDYIVPDDCDTKKRCKNPVLIREAVEWLLDDVMGTFDIGNERFLLCNNRISKNSILANLHRQMVELKPAGEQWYHLKVNALDKNGEPTWPEKYTRQYWVTKKSQTTQRSWEREYMNNPIEEGTIFKEVWIKWKEMLPLNKYDDLVCYTDPSFKATEHSDYKAIKFWGRAGTELHCIDAFVRQCSIDTMVKKLYDMWEAFEKLGVQVRFFIETNFLQDLFLDAIAEEGEQRGYQLHIRGDDSKKPDKLTRIEAMSPLYERGFVYYNAAKKLDPDFATSVEQLLAIEPGSKMADDSPDADEGAWSKLLKGARVGKIQPVVGEREQRYNW